MNQRRYVLGVGMAMLLVLPSLPRSAGQTHTNQTHTKQSDPAKLEYFERYIRPALVENCFECHSQKKSMGGLRLDSWQPRVQGGDSGKAIDLDQPGESLLLRAIRHTDADYRMPPKGKLPDEVIGRFERWIRDGAVAPMEIGAPVEEGFRTATAPIGMSVAEGREFWSMRPVGNPLVPVVQQTEWVETPIDAFVLFKLEQMGMRPTAAVDRRTWIRRATYDLIGLPPTSEQVEAFERDDSPGAFQNVIDRLLESPQYGVRWGRHWLDVARYADSNGLDENLALGNAWRYRDWVISAFNRDLPYDRFVVEQLAGDLLPEADARSRIATGFLVLGAKVLAEPDREKLEMDTIDEQIDATGKAFLGMTLGCARCHDHKFDPILQSDYYAMAAIFKSTKTFAGTNTGAIKHWNEFSLPADESLARELTAIDARIAELKTKASKCKSEAMTSLREKARTKASKYLVAATRIRLDSPFSELADAAQGEQLLPRVLHHCRRHLHFHRDDPFFEPWHAMASAGDTEGIQRHYQALFEGAMQAWEQAKAKDPKVKQLEDPVLEQARSVLNDTTGLLAIPEKPEHALDADTLAEFHRLSEEARLAESHAADWPAAMGVTDGKVHPQLAIHIRGNHRQLGEQVERGFPEVLRFEGATIFPRHESGRLQMARWIAHPSNPLTARVWVNRVWGWHFGEGLVPSTENFGKLGSLPSHPELLDWLTRYFIESGWSTKNLHRLLMRSQVYRMDSAPDGEEPESMAAADPENRLLRRFRLRRLEAEEIRDSILVSAGILEMTMGGKSVPLRNRQFVFDHTSIDHTRYDSYRRSIFLPVIRNHLYTLFEQFNFPDPTMPTGARAVTTVAPQSLLFMNDPMVLEAADRAADRLMVQSLDKTQRIDLAYQAILSRLPSDTERAHAAALIDAVLAPSTGTTDPGSQRQAWSLLCQGLMASNEFIYVR